MSSGITVQFGGNSDSVIKINRNESFGSVIQDRFVGISIAHFREN